MQAQAMEEVVQIHNPRKMGVACVTVRDCDQ